VKTGFKTSNDGVSTLENDYYRSGCGIELVFKSGVVGNVDDIVTAVLKTCPVPMMVSYIYRSSDNLYLIYSKGACQY
jgi:hypothetical protein